MTDTSRRQPDGAGVQPGGDAGRDSQAGNSWSVRCRLPGRPGARITRTAARLPDDAGSHGWDGEPDWAGRA